ncbi:hypothetical protein MLD38_002545 [Melastoma candidum]|uniref:Uncharacterized protein n=1 Tax=Melastoma candidum TaxID=119954 RepID=A0ACB9S0A3_9MYRT|nr:hypothetical protein MLD38_002545 [Melastoma candidum]
MPDLGDFYGKIGFMSLCALMGPETLMLSTSALAAGPSADNSSPTALAPGFRFHPTDEELVVYYLKRKVSGKSFRFDAIAVVDIYKTEPWDLAGKSKLKTRDQEWYFFGALDKKYTEEELEKCGAQQDPYVLCRIFHKANLGPPTGNRYAPFVEEEWDCKTDVVPGLVPSSQAENGEELKHQGNDTVQEAPSFAVSVCPRKLPAKTQFLLAVCKSETLSETLEDRAAVCPPCREIPAILRHKRKKDIDLNSIDSNVTESSPKKVNSPSSSTTTAAASPAENSSSRLSALVEYSLLESLENRNRARNAADMTSSLPTKSQEFIDSLQEEIYKASMERETLRLEMLSIRSKAHVLQAQLEHLMNENENLKRKLP